MSRLSKTRPKPLPQEPPQAVTARRSRCCRTRLLKLPPGPLGNGQWAVDHGAWRVRRHASYTVPFPAAGGLAGAARPVSRAT